MPKRRIPFSEIEWESVADGFRVKRFEQNGKTIRLLELTRELSHPDWCETGHSGYVVEGDIEIIFENDTKTYFQGDAIFIKSGESEKHIPKPLSEKVILFLVDSV